MGINQDFKQYVGQIIKDPDRLTCDTDPVADALNQESQKHGLLLHFKKATDTEPFMLDVVAAHVYITKEGVPDDQAAWGWRISHIRCDKD